jgi:tagatose 1,6-diphosphate aldolase
MAKVTMTRGKFNCITACADANGVIAAAAADQRGSLQKAIAKARGENGKATSTDLSTFKTAVTRILTKHASAILMDPEYGMEAIAARQPGTGVLISYEKTGYDVSVKGRMPDLLSEWSVRRLVAAGAHGIKILLYYNPDDDAAINNIKHAFIERIGSECRAMDVAFFLEPLAYNDELGNEQSLEFARKKPEYVTRYMAEFSKPQYGVDILKVEVPVNVKYVEGMRTYVGQTAYTRAEAMQFFRDSAAVATKPFIYLSAGVSDEAFRETLELAAEAGTDFSGVLCGRATWQDGIPVFGSEGLGALEAWLEDRGVKNINLLNEVLAKGAKPWYTIYGGRENIDVIDPVPAVA